MPAQPTDFDSFCFVPWQDKCHPQTIAVCQTRAEGLGLQAIVVADDKFVFDKDTCGMMLQYPATDGTIHDYKVRYGRPAGSELAVAIFSICIHWVWTGSRQMCEPLDAASQTKYASPHQNSHRDLA